MSDDGAHALVLIAMLGNVFSPRWAAAREGATPVRSLDFSAVNVALHAGARSAWVMTERDASAITREPDHLAIGGTDLRWEGDVLVVHVDERTAPFGRRVRGTIRFRPDVCTTAEVTLDGRGRHRWFPHAPVGRLEVDFEEPRVRFEGHGYFDANAGDEPLEAAFRSWSWSRFATDEHVALAYDVTLADGTSAARGIRATRDGTTSSFDVGGARAIGRSRFGLERHVRTEPGARAELVRTLEDGPFYARSLVRTTVEGRSAIGMHETVSLERFTARWVRFLVPFRMRVEGAR